MNTLDQVIERCGTFAVTWNHLAQAFDCEEDALPLRVVDLDFVCIDPLLSVLKKRIDHPIFDYEEGFDECEKGYECIHSACPKRIIKDCLKRIATALVR